MMTINSKGSRKIVLDNDAFTWVISPDSGYLVFVAEHREEKGSRIEVYIHSYFDGQDRIVIKPKNAKSIITQAMEMGWNPKAKGKPMVFDLVKDSLIKRKN